MKPGWLIGIGMLFISLSVVSGILEQQYLGRDDAGLLYRLLNSYSEINFGNPLVAIGSMVTGSWQAIGALWGMFWFSYAFFEGTWQIVRFAVFLPISVALAVSLVLAGVRGVSSA